MSNSSTPATSSPTTSSASTKSANPKRESASAPKGLADGAGMFSVKRLFDLCFSLVVLVALAPVFLLLALAIKLDSRGPVFFKQLVVGRGGKPFRLFKFRSMLPGSQNAAHRKDVLENLKEGRPTSFDKNGRPIYKSAITDPSRITRVGRWLRRTSLDELPQFWNVLRGEMSVVGPRPALLYEADHYEDWQRERLSIRPGLTGWYQVTARNCVSIEEMVRLDIEYVRAQSLWLDLKIVLKTPAAMLKGI